MPSLTWQKCLASLMTTLSSLIWTGVCLKTWWTSVSFNWLIVSVSPNKLSGRDCRMNTSSFNSIINYTIMFSGSHVHASLFCLIFMESAKCRILSGMLSLPTSTRYMKFNLSQPNKVLVFTVHSGLHLHTGIRLLGSDISPRPGSKCVLWFCLNAFFF